MTDFENKESRSILRRPAVIASGLAILAVSTWLAVRSPTNNNTLIYEWQKSQKGGQDTGSGITVANMTSSGALTLSGSLKVSDSKTGSGDIKVGGSDGGRTCLADSDGTGCTCTQGNNGVLTSWIGSVAECP